MNVRKSVFLSAKRNLRRKNLIKNTHLRNYLMQRRGCRRGGRPCPGPWRRCLWREDGSNHSHPEWTTACTLSCIAEHTRVSVVTNTGTNVHPNVIHSRYTWSTRYTYMLGTTDKRTYDPTYELGSTHEPTYKFGSPYKRLYLRLFALGSYLTNTNTISIC